MSFNVFLCVEFNVYLESCNIVFKIFLFSYSIVQIGLLYNALIVFHCIVFFGFIILIPEIFLLSFLSFKIVIICFHYLGIIFLCCKDFDVSTAKLDFPDD